MIERYKDIARGLVVVLGLAMPGSAARAEQPFILQDSKATSVTPSAAAPNAVPQAPAVQPNAPAAPQVDAGEISQRVGQEVGYDVHAAIDGWKRGLDLCEIAQSIGSSGKQPVRYWMHNNMLTINGQKMGKSLNNFINLDELFTGKHKLLEQAYSPMTLRFCMLQSHYRNPIDFSNKGLQDAEKGYAKLNETYFLLRGTCLHGQRI